MFLLKELHETGHRKTHLVVMSPKRTNDPQPRGHVIVNGTEISETQSAVHLGLIRSSSLSNFHSIQDRMSKHMKSMFLVLSSGGCRGHHANPAASLKIQSLYSSPILFSGLGSLILS